MSNNQDINIRVKADTKGIDELNKEFSKYEAEIKKTQSALRSLELQNKRNSEEYSEAQRRIRELRTEQRELANTVKTSSSTNKEYTASVNTTSTSMASMAGKAALVSAGILAVVYSLKQGIDALIQFGTKGVEAFGQQENAIVGLQFSLNNNEKSLRNLIEVAGELQSKSIFGDELIMESMRFLALQGLNEQQIIDTTKAAIELSSKMGIDLNTATQQLAQTWEGSIGRLGRFDNDLKSLTKEQLLNGKAVDIINEKYSGLSETLSNTTLNTMTKLKNVIGDIWEAVGQFLNPVLKPLIDLMLAVSTEVYKVVQAFVDVQAKVFGVIKDILTADKTFSSLSDTIKTLWANVSGLLITSFQKLGEEAIKVWDTIKNFFEALNETGGAVAFVEANFKILIATINIMVNTLTLLIRGMNIFLAGITGVIKSINEFVSSIVNGFRNVINRLDEFRQKAVQVFESFRSRVDSGRNAVGNLIEIIRTLANRLSQSAPGRFFTSIYNRVRDVIKGIVSFLKGLPEGVKRFLGLDIDFTIQEQGRAITDSDTDKVGTTGTTGTSGKEKQLKEEKEKLDEIQQLQKKITELEADRVVLITKYGEQSEVVQKNIRETAKLQEDLARLLAPTFGLPQLTPSFSPSGSIRNISPISQSQKDEINEMERLRLEGEKLTFINEALNDSLVSLTSSFREFFSGLASGDLDAFKSFLKSIANTFLTFVQALVLGADAAMLAKGITTFGLSLLKDAPLKAAALIALEGAKGIVDGLYTGGQAKANTPYFVGENPDGSLNRTSELFIPNSSGTVLNARDTQSVLRMLTGGMNNQSVTNVYINAEANDYLIFKRGHQKNTRMKNILKL